MSETLQPKLAGPVVQPLLGRVDTGSAYGAEFDFVSADGTQIRGWRNGATGPPILIAPGLGTLPEAWPGLLNADCGLRAVTWYQRGTFGSHRPSDPGAIGLDDHVDDAIALMDAEGIERAVVGGWSMGVNIAFELALRAPERVAGILGVAGVPGDTFRTIGEPLGIPSVLRAPAAATAARGLRAVGPLLNFAAHRIPLGLRFTHAMQTAGLLLPEGDDAHTVEMLRRFITHDWAWYMTLALRLREHKLVDVRAVTCPVTLISGSQDVLTAATAIAALADQLPQARIQAIDGTHFLPIEHPEVCMQELRALVALSSLTAVTRPRRRVRGRTQTLNSSPTAPD